MRTQLEQAQWEELWKLRVELAAQKLRAEKLGSVLREALDVIRTAVRVGTEGLEGFNPENHVTVKRLAAALVEDGARVEGDE